MAGRPQGKQRRDVTVPVRFDRTLAAKMDAKRSGTSRSTYIRRLVTADTMEPEEAHALLMQAEDMT